MPRDNIMLEKRQTTILYFDVITHIGKSARCVKNTLVTHKRKLLRLENSQPTF